MPEELERVLNYMEAANKPPQRKEKQKAKWLPESFTNMKSEEKQKQESGKSTSNTSTEFKDLRRTRRPSSMNSMHVRRKTTERERLDESLENVKLSRAAVRWWVQ